MAGHLRNLLPRWVKDWRRRQRRNRSILRGNLPASPAQARESFGALVDDRERWLFATLPRAAAEAHRDIYDKDSQKRLAQRLGVDIAHDYAAAVPLDEAIAYVERSGLERFVIKPTSSYSGIGCHSLIRDGNAFLDLRSGRRLRTGRLKGLLRSELIRGRDDAWIVEELLLPVGGSLSVIEDYKCYCFGGTVELILHKRPVPGPKKYHAQFHARDWTPVNVGMEDRDDLVAAAPRNGRRIVEVAERAASQLCYPFIRIDLYDTTRGVVLGELTPGPGRSYGFDDAWDARLVQRWHEAAAAIEEGIRSGRIEPLAW